MFSISTKAKGMIRSIRAFCHGRITPVSLDDLAQRWSSKTDSIILQKEKECRYQYIGGHFAIECLDETCFAIAIDMYFKNQQDELIKVKLTGPSKPMSVLTPESSAEIQQQKRVVFEIQRPKQEDSIEKPMSKDRK